MSIYLHTDLKHPEIPLGIYIHFPYCNKRCPYCDFTLTTKAIDHQAYLHAVLKELTLHYIQWIDHNRSRRLHSIYLGGGTPGLWDIEAVRQLMIWMREHFEGVDTAEVTIEANPAEITLAQAQAWRQMGINRLSLGTQSFDDKNLHYLGRTHTAQQARHAVTWARMAGFERINLDLIHGMVGQGVHEACQDLLYTLELEPEHIALYQLSIEKRTSFGARASRGEQLLVPEQRLVEIYQALDEQLQEAGLPLYEISNAAKPNEFSRHNMLYWTLGQYWGVGVGAHGLVHNGMQGRRWQNIRSIRNYLEYLSSQSVDQVTSNLAQYDHNLSQVVCEESEPLSDHSLWEESIMVGLRLRKGLVITDKLRDRYAIAFDKQIKQGFIEEVEGHWRASAKGRMLLDHITYQILLDDSV